MRQPICLQSGAGFHSGAEIRLAAAVAHLIDLWNMADALHSRAVIDALHALFASPLGCTNGRALRDLAHNQLGYDGMIKLYDELYDDCGCPLGTHAEIIQLLDAYDKCQFASTPATKQTGFTERQRDGLACSDCGAEGRPMRPCGSTLDNRQLFVCDRCPDDDVPW